LEGWRTEIIIVSTAFVVVLLVGINLSITWPLLALATAGYCGWHIAQLNTLRKWLRSPASLEPPVGIGIWDDIFESLYQRKRAADAIHKRQQSELDILQGTS
jgi:hypothetical protein